jgi:predicted secreted protein
MRAGLLRCAALLAANPAGAETLLRLSETATVMAAPDEMFASLRVSAVSPTAAAAQARVNAVMQEALAAAKAVAGLTVSTGRYAVWRAAPTPPDRTERWQAGQTLELSGHDDAALLQLTGELQQKGLATDALGWRLSRETERSLHDKAVGQALGALRGRIDAAAGVLDLRFDQFKEVRIDRPAAQPLMARAMAAPAMAPGAAPPNAAPEDVAVSATVEADAVLVAR